MRKTRMEELLTTQPIIEWSERQVTRTSEYRLTVPWCYLQAVRWPRIALSWWMLKLIWRQRAEAPQDG